MRNTLLKSTAIAALLIVSSFAYAQAPTDSNRNEPKKEKIEKSAPPKAQEQKGGAQQAQQPRPEPSRNAAGQQNKPETTGQVSQPAKSDQQPEQKADQKKAPDKKAEERPKAEPKGAPARGNAQGAKEPEKSKSTAAPSQQQQQKGATTAPAQQNQQPAAAQQTPQNQRPAAAQSNTPSPNTAQQPSSSTATTTNAPAGATTATNASQLPPQKQVQISETITRTRVAPPQRNLNVSIHIGTVVPPRVRFHPLPREIWSIEPAYRGYEYFTTEEDIVIIEPRTRRVVSMVPRDASRARAQLGSTTSMAQGGGGGTQCQVMRRDPASGQLSEVRPSTVGAGGSNAPLSVTVQLSGGQMSPPVALDAPAGQIVVATQGNGDCQITIEPQPR